MAVSARVGAVVIDVGETLVAEGRMMTRHQARFARPASCVEMGLTVRDALATAARRHVRLIPPTDRRIALIGGLPPPPNWGHTMR